MILLREHFVIDVDVWGYDCEVRLNGYGVHTPWRGPFRGVVSINHWIVPGENTLEIAVQGVESDFPELADPIESEDEEGHEPEEPKPPRWARACVGLEHDVEQGTIVGEGDGEVLADIGLDCFTIDESDLPGSMTTSFECMPMRPRWRWQDAKVLAVELSDEEQAAFTAFVLELRDCAERRDLGAIMKWLEPTIAERATAFEQQPADLVTVVANEYRALFAEPSFSLATSRVAELVPHFHCGGRVIEVTAKDGQPFIRQSARNHPDGDWTMPLLVGLHQGSWSVLSL